MEFRKGTLFIRLKGELSKKTVSKLDQEVTELVMKNGLYRLVFNVENLSAIDKEGINSLYKHYELCHDEKGDVCLCGMNQKSIREKLEQSRLLNYVFEAKDELSALSFLLALS